MRLITLLSLCLFLMNCSVNEENNNDLTTDIAGEYQGSFSSDLDDIGEFNVIVTRVDDDTIELQPGDGSSFLGVTVDVQENSNLDIINQPDQRFGTTVSFTGATQNQLTFQIDPSGFDAQFNGTKL